MLEKSLNSSSIRLIVRAAYDMQKQRISTGLRIVSHIKSIRGQAPSRPERELSTEDRKLLTQIREDFKRVTDEYAIPLGKIVPPKKFKGSPLIPNSAVLQLCSIYEQNLRNEKQQFDNLKYQLVGIPIWETFLKNIPGIGPAIAGVIISEIKPYDQPDPNDPSKMKIKYASSFHAYAGVDVAQDGKGRSSRKEHLVPKFYTDFEGNVKETVGITYNKFLKSKLVYVGGGSLLKAVTVEYFVNNVKVNKKDWEKAMKLNPEKCSKIINENKYSQIYRDIKHRYMNDPKHKPVIIPDPKKPKKSKLVSGKWPKHIHAMSNRYMIKRFLTDLYIHWRKLIGEVVHDPYEVAKLGMKHSR